MSASTNQLRFAAIPSTTRSSTTNKLLALVLAIVGVAFASESVRAQIVYPSYGDISTIAGNGNWRYSGDGGLATNATLWEPWSTAVDNTGNVYIADTYNNRIRMVSAATGIISTVAGNGTEGYSGDGGPATSAELSYPLGVAVDAAGNI